MQKSKLDHYRAIVLVMDVTMFLMIAASGQAKSVPLSIGALIGAGVSLGFTIGRRTTSP